MARQLASNYFLALLLLLAVVFAAVRSENGSTPLRGISDITTTQGNLSSSEIVVFDEANLEERAKDSSEIENQDEDEEKEKEDEEEDRLEVEKDEYNDEDEYEDELRAVAESHEAMSKDEGKATNSSEMASMTRGSTGGVADSFEQSLRAMKNFDSQENGSDESETSNEMFDENALKEKDHEVKELLWYKNMNRYEESDENGKKKVKRVPTVKKELSTQKEINVGNETDIGKRFSTKEVLDQLNQQVKDSGQTTPETSVGEAEQACGQNELAESGKEYVPKTSKVYFERPSLESKILVDTKFSDLETFSEPPPQLDKRQETAMKDQEAYLRLEYEAEQEQRRKLQKLGAQESVLTESLLKLLVKLAENPRRWERVHRLLMDIEGRLELSRRAFEARKRIFDMNSPLSTMTIPTTTTPPPPTTISSPLQNTPKKNRKKPKKKKKKKKLPHHHSFSTITATAISSIPPMLTTTETPWLTTPMQWRLVAERLFGPPWHQDLQEDPDVAKVRFSVSSNARTPSPLGEFRQQLQIDDKQENSHKASNTEHQALMLQSAREYAQPRRLHYGKVSTHQTSIPHRDSASSYASDREISRIRDYDPADRNYQHYDQFSSHSRGRNHKEDFIAPEDYAQNHEYRSSGREYAASKGWQDSQFKYGRPSWKTEERPGLPDKWAWRQPMSDLKLWPQIDERKPWQIDRDYWSHAENDDDKAWPPQQQRPPWEKIGEPADNWSIKSSKQVPPWSAGEKTKAFNRQESIAPWENDSKGRSDESSELSRESLKQQNKDGGMNVPKITMKTWNSLTSDPATWPFKLPSAKPWPKNENGEAYNPNADLVRKLGLDKQSRLLSEKDVLKDFQNEYQSDRSGKYKNGKAKSKDLSTKIQAADLRKESIPWPVNLSSVKQWPGKSFGRDSELMKVLSLEDNVRSWNGNVESGQKAWPGQTAMSPKIQSVGAWVMPADQSTWKPYNLKPIDSYGRGIEDPDRRRWFAGLNPNERTRPSSSGDNPWSSKLADNWNGFEKSMGTGTWPKWKQFAYHRVTAMPILRADSAMDGTRPRGAFIAVSAVAPKYDGNQWQKNDIEETPVRQINSGSLDPDHPTSQLHAGVQPGIYTWKRDGSLTVAAQRNANATDPLEQQLEQLRRNASWSDGKNVNSSEKQLNSISDSSISLPILLTSSVTSNSSTGTYAEEFTKEIDERVSLQPNANGNKEILMK